MTDEELLSLLQNDPYRAFCEIGAVDDLALRPGPLVFKLALERYRELARSPTDEEASTRMEATFALGTHWAYEPAFSAFCQALLAETDRDAFQHLLGAIAIMGDRIPRLAAPALQTMRMVCLNESVDSGLRWSAFVKARYMVGELTGADYVRQLKNPGIPDSVWFDQRLAHPAAVPVDADGDQAEDSTRSR